MKPHRLKLFFLVLVILFVVIIALNVSFRANNNRVTDSINKIPQNALLYLDPATANQPLIAGNTQRQLTQNFLEHYFTPWADKRVRSATVTKPSITPQDIKEIELDYIKQFTKHPGWGLNRHLNDQTWIAKIISNMNLSQFPNHQQKAITIQNTNLRILPTDEPSFGNWNKAGEGYPFDYVQVAILPANTPIFILQTTQDGAWNLVLMNTDLGWIKTQDIANVDEMFIHTWQTESYIAIIKDYISVFDDKKLFRFKANIGWIFPLEKTSNNSESKNFKILIAVADANRNAVIKTAEIPKQQAAILPLVVTPKNLALVANNLLGIKYGWGGIGGYRDCSSTMMNLFTPFGIWLPRNSSDQAEIGTITDLRRLSAKRKTQVISQQGIPFLTLLHLPGHVVLYIGRRDGDDYILHDFWGLHTKTIFGREGRAIVGKTVITPLNLGEGYINVPKRFIDWVQSMTVLGGKN